MGTAGAGKPGPASIFLVWTTTPWTLPANVALAVHPDLDYVKVRQRRQGLLILGTRRSTSPPARAGATVLETAEGADLVGLRFQGPFDELPAARDGARAPPVIAWEDVGEEEGTGIVHIAPGCGAEDYELSKAQGLAVIIPIDEAGALPSGSGALDGQGPARRRAGDLRDLDAKGRLFRAEHYSTATRAAGAAARSWRSASPTSGSSARTSSGRR